MTLHEYINKYPHRPPPIPGKYAGQWIAWDAERHQILAHGTEMSEVRNAAVQAGYPDPVLQKVPRSPFVG
jgi:hypothetical protein